MLLRRFYHCVTCDVRVLPSRSYYGVDHSVELCVHMQLSFSPHSHSCVNDDGEKEGRFALLPLLQLLLLLFSICTKLEEEEEKLGREKCDHLKMYSTSSSFNE